MADHLALAGLGARAISEGTRILVIGSALGTRLGMHPPEGVVEAARARLEREVNAAGLRVAVVALPPGLVPHVSTQASQDLARIGEGLLAQLAPLEWSGRNRRTDAGAWVPTCPRCGGLKPTHRPACPLQRAVTDARALGLGK